MDRHDLIWNPWHGCFIQDGAERKIHNRTEQSVEAPRTGFAYPPADSIPIRNWLISVLSGVIPAEQTMSAGKVELSATKLNLTVGSTKTIKLNNLSGDKKAKWSVSDKKVIQIKKKSAGKAVVEAKKAGKATVTARVGKKKYQCGITVKKKTDASAKLPKANASEIWAKYDKDPNKYEPTYDGELVNATGVVNYIGEDSHGTPAGKDTKDKVFLLSGAELSKYLPKEALRRAKPTTYAISHGAYTNEAGDCAWWLRSPGETKTSPAYISSGGSVGSRAHEANETVIGVRPAIWVQREVLANN